MDNASPEPVAPRFDLGWHPRARVVVEPEMGLTAARLRGISEASAPLLVFVDDDNVLSADYLKRALSLAALWPMLGVWGSGTYTPEWEQEPPAEFAPYLAYLAVQQIPRDRWSNRLFDYDATPAGAGICVRAPVAQAYAAKVRTDPRRKLLGRTGASLSGCEDHDLAFTAIDTGLGTGVFKSLSLVHLMPRGRVAESYLLRLVDGHACSSVILHALRDPTARPPRRNLLSWVRETRLRRALSPIALKIHDAKRRGEARAWALIRSSSEQKVT